MDQAQNEWLVGSLAAVITAVETTSRTILPQTHLDLLQSIVETAARIFAATGSAIALLTEDGQELEFKVAYSTQGPDVVGMRFPTDQGIAGYAVMTGQPLAVSSVTEDARFNQRFAEAVGYIPDSILAVPLVQQGDVIGVIEVLDKVNQQSFTMQDIELLTIFARQAALAIGQFQQVAQLQGFFMASLRGLAAGEAPAAEWTGARSGQSAPTSELLQLVQMIQTAGQLEGQAQAACSEVLRTFQVYGRTRTAVSLRKEFARFGS